MKKTQTISVGNILKVLPSGTDQEILDTLNSFADITVKARRLKDILRPHAAALEKIGLLPDYTAYALLNVMICLADNKGPGTGNP